MIFNNVFSKTRGLGFSKKMCYNNRDRMAKMRKRIKRCRGDLLMTKQYDVVVCGGGFSGFAAAYSAAREGARTILAERNGCLGGVGTQGLVNHLLGARLYDNGKIYQSIGGLYKTLAETLLGKGGKKLFKPIKRYHISTNMTYIVDEFKKFM